MSGSFSEQLNNIDTEVKEEALKVPFILKIISTFFSVLFHPVFIPVYVTFFLLYIHPSAFTGFSASNKQKTLVIVALNLVFFPMLSVALLKAVGFIDSLLLKTRKDRIIPYIACGIFFFWAYTVFKQQTAYPLLLVSYVLGLFLSSSAALIANIYYKVSMHAIGLGGCLGLFLIIMQSSSMLMTVPIAIALLVTGLVSTSRLMLKSHNPFDIYSGLIIGIATQFIAADVVL